MPKLIHRSSQIDFFSQYTLLTDLREVIPRWIKLESSTDSHAQLQMHIHEDIR